MKFFEVLKRRKILFLNIFLFLYIAMNLFTGDRGVFSYFEKKEIKKNLENKKEALNNKVNDFEHKNTLLSENLDFDYVDMLIREKLRFGKKEEIIIKLND
ncbi:MAG: septation ring formation regulator EzrA [Candidatus Pelagibacter sp.]|nr:septation ring formation regulator EzrA [Candidatus Pelagibacter sp.]|tara:strand:- start:841 stop:1140 length:300 start_codon:yes stop_codon:yes gene_type:complete